MILAFDLDDVICGRPSAADYLGIDKYQYCYAHYSMIDVINALYDQGHTIKVFTARGMTHFAGDVAAIYAALFEQTKKQLEGWGVKYHELIMGKTHYDVLVDDKVVNSLDVKSPQDVLTLGGRIAT